MKNMTNNITDSVLKTIDISKFHKKRYIDTDNEWIGKIRSTNLKSDIAYYVINQIYNANIKRLCATAGGGCIIGRNVRCLVRFMSNSNKEKSFFFSRFKPDNGYDYVIMVLIYESNTRIFVIDTKIKSNLDLLIEETGPLHGGQEGQLTERDLGCGFTRIPEWLQPFECKDVNDDKLILKKYTKGIAWCGDDEVISPLGIDNTFQHILTTAQYDCEIKNKMVTEQKNRIKKNKQKYGQILLLNDSPSVGLFGEHLFWKLYGYLGYDVGNSESSQHDKKANGCKFEVKNAIMTKDGILMWHDIKLSYDFNFLFLIGVCADIIYYFCIPMIDCKMFDNKNILKQFHGNKDNSFRNGGLSINASDIPAWLQPFRCGVVNINGNEYRHNFFPRQGGDVVSKNSLADCQETMSFNIDGNYFRSALMGLVRDGGTHADILIKLYCGISREGFRKYLESHFRKYMSWENAGGVLSPCWHIDHSIPFSNFNMNDENDVKKCFHYSNLCPMWNEVNNAKSNYDLPEQKIKKLNMRYEQKYFSNVITIV